MVETCTGLGYLVSGGDVDLTVDATLKPYFCHCWAHVYPNHIGSMWPNQPKIASISTPKIKDSAVELIVLICRVFPSAPVAEWRNMGVQFSDLIIAS
jgi:hypothetical protein